MLENLPCEAIRTKKCLEVIYDGFWRVVEVHAVGLSRDGNPVMRVWQIRGGSKSGELPGWRLLRLDEARGGSLTDETSLAPRDGYQRNDSHIPRIKCQI